jgi:hypothetical protein
MEYKKIYFFPLISATYGTTIKAKMIPKKNENPSNPIINAGSQSKFILSTQLSMNSESLDVSEIATNESLL